MWTLQKLFFAIKKMDSTTPQVGSHDFSEKWDVLCFSLCGVRSPPDHRQNFEKIRMRASGRWCRTLARSAVR